jgi:hypothetical protein
LLRTGLDNAAFVNCPGCGTLVADGEAICPKCDYIIDAGAFSDEPPEQDDEGSATGAGAPAPATAKPGAKLRPSGAKASPRKETAQEVPRARPAPGKRPSGVAAAAQPSSTQIKSIEEIEKARTKRPAAPPGKSPSRKSAGQAMPDAPSRRVAAAPSAPVADWHVKPDATGSGPVSSPNTSGYHIAAPEDVLKDAKSFVIGLPGSDKIAFAGLAFNILFAFFPWKETVLDGDVLGLMSLGFPVFAVSIVGITSIVIRVRQFMPKLNPLIPWLLQLSAVCFCLVWCLIFIKLSWDSRLARSPVGNFDMYLSKPSIGVFLSLLTSVVALGGTLMGLKEKPA